MRTAYTVKADGEIYIVIADNMADACDKLDAKGFETYWFVEHKSIQVIDWN